MNEFTIVLGLIAINAIPWILGTFWIVDQLVKNGFLTENCINEYGTGKKGARNEVG